MNVLTDIGACRVEDLLITATDNLNRLTSSIKMYFRSYHTDLCNTSNTYAYRYVVWKYKKAFTKDIKLIYDAPTREAVKAALDGFPKK